MRRISAAGSETKTWRAFCTRQIRTCRDKFLLEDIHAQIRPVAFLELRSRSCELGHRYRSSAENLVFPKAVLYPYGRSAFARRQIADMFQRVGSMRRYHLVT